MWLPCVFHNPELCPDGSGVDGFVSVQARQRVEETQALLDSLVESLPTAQMLLLCNYRPEYRHSWGSKTYYTQLRLDPLEAKEAGELEALAVKPLGVGRLIFGYVWGTLALSVGLFLLVLILIGVFAAG